MDKDFAYLLGVYFGDGHIDYDKGAYQFIVVSEDEDLCTICNDICHKLIEKRGSVTKIENYYKLVICSKELCQLILTHTSSNPEFACANKNEKKGVLPRLDGFEHDFVVGLMDSDGWIRETVNGRYLKYEFGFKNTSAIRDKFHAVMNSIGLKCNKIENGTYQSLDGIKEYSSWTINPKSFIEHCSFRIKRKNAILKKCSLRKAHKTRKSSTILIRLTEEDHESIQLKSSIVNLKMSQLFRDAMFSYWPNTNANAIKIRQLYQKSEQKTKKQIVDFLTKFYRFQGYPFRQFTKEELLHEMRKVAATKNIINGTIMTRNSNGLALANYFHPQIVEASKQSGISPMRAYMNDEKLSDCIQRLLDLNQLPSKSGIRAILRNRDYVGTVYNFRPTIAKYIYDTYCPENGLALDPCAGYGGRLAGCIASNKNIMYHGIDPDGYSACGNAKLAGFFKDARSGIEQERDFQFGFRFDLGCAEDIMPTLNKRTYDLIFTSPPYFKTEKYSDQADQSYKRYPKYDDWKELFLRKVITTAVDLLKIGGYLIWNTKNYKQFSIANDSEQLGLQCGLTYVKTYFMELTNREFGLKVGQSAHHEPIIVFQLTS